MKKLAINVLDKFWRAEGVCKMKKISDNNYILFILLTSVGIILRFFVMTLGHNYDFNSYCIVGEITGNFRNVYAETFRYNYGFIFSCIQGLLYKIAELSKIKTGDNWILLYRMMIVGVLTMADLGITCFISKQYSIKKALLFFLNPVSIFITGYHNQFDNIAIFFALLCILFYNEDEKFCKKDILFVLFFALSLITKHILCFLPVFVLLKKGLPVKKKITYAILPPIIFILSFVPFALSSSEALHGIVENVFLYRSFNNAPLLKSLYCFTNPTKIEFLAYVVSMCIFAFCIRKKAFDEQIFLYLIAMVSFSSAITNQYLAIPMAALCVLEIGVWKYLYMAEATLFLFLDAAGLNALHYIVSTSSFGLTVKAAKLYAAKGYTMAAWILLLTIIYLMIKEKRNMAD